MKTEWRAVFERIPWFAPLRGGWPAPPTTDALPTASAAYAYRLVTLRGTPDITYQCLRDGAGAWEWATVASGTP